MEPLQPKLRFPGFEGDWESKFLDEISNINMGQSPSSSSYNIEMNGMPLIQGNADIRNRISFPRNWTSEPTKICEIGDIILTVRAPVGAVAKSIHKACIGRGVCSIKNKSNLKIDFLYQFLLDYEDKWSSLEQGSTFTAVSSNEIKKIKINVPSLEEQTKIADFLSAMDERLNLLEEKRALLEAYKKGVMQQLFNQELRFKDDDGKDFGEWEEVLLGNISDVRDGTHDSPKYVNDGYPLITSKNLNSNGKLDFNNIEYITQLDFDKINKRSKVDIGDIIFGMIGTIGNPVLLKSDNFAIKNVALIKEKDILKNCFLIHYLNSSLILNQFKKENVGGTQKFLSLGIIRNLKILLPSIEEQTKIANFLSALDEKIELVGKQIEDTQVYKKGLLQQLFV